MLPVRLLWWSVKTTWPPHLLYSLCPWCDPTVCLLRWSVKTTCSLHLLDSLCPWCDPTVRLLRWSVKTTCSLHLLDSLCPWCDPTVRLLRWSELAHLLTQWTHNSTPQVRGPVRKYNGKLGIIVRKYNCAWSGNKLTCWSATVFSYYNVDEYINSGKARNLRI